MLPDFPLLMSPFFPHHVLVSGQCFIEQALDAAAIIVIVVDGVLVVVVAAAAVAIAAAVVDTLVDLVVAVSPCFFRSSQHEC